MKTRQFALFLASTLVVFTAACSGDGPTEPAMPTVVPAGSADPAWASLGKSCTETSPVTLLPASKRDSLDPFTHGPPRSSDDEWADAARSIPGGWGGLFLEGGVPTIFLVDTRQRDAAVAAIRSRFTFPGLDLTATVAKPARWNFAQLADWFRYLNLYVFDVPGMRSADINESANRLEYGVIGAAGRANLEAVLTRLNLPCYLVAIRLE